MQHKNQKHQSLAQAIFKEDLPALLESQKWILVDIRMPLDFLDGHLRGALNITTQEELFTLLDIKVYIAKEMSSIDKRYQTIFKFANSIKRQTVIVTSKQNIDINLSDDANIMSCQDFKNNLIKDNHIVHNELFSSEIDYIIDDIALYYSTLKKELSLLKEDLINL